MSECMIEMADDGKVTILLQSGINSLKVKVATKISKPFDKLKRKNLKFMQSNSREKRLKHCNLKIRQMCGCGMSKDESHIALIITQKIRQL